MLYITSDYSRGLGSENFVFYCNRVGEIPMLEPVYFVYDLQNNFRKASLSNGYIENPRIAAINKTNDLIAVSNVKME